MLLPSQLTSRIRLADRAVVFTGAGVSQESGIATFRDAGGLWSGFRPEELATPEGFERRPDVVWRWYAERYGALARADPNPAHHAIARLEELFASFLVVTQNVDGLHQRAATRKILEVHGTLAEARCHRCDGSDSRRTMAEAVASSPNEPPVCSCGGLMRPAVVWFGEMLPEGVLEEASEASARCDVFLSVGTSAVVFPAAGLIEVALGAGAALIEVNPERTPFSAHAALRLTEPAGVALPELVQEIERCRRSTT